MREALKRSETTLAKIQNRLRELEAKLHADELYTHERRGELADLLREQAELKSRHAEAEEAWLAAASAMEQAAERLS